MARLENALAPYKTTLPQTAAALTAMREALDVEAPQRGSKRPSEAASSAPYAISDGALIKRLRNRVQYLERRCAVLRGAARMRARTKGRISTLLVAQVSLSAPGSNARAFARAQRDFAAKDEAVSRPTIESIRDAFVAEAKRSMEDAAAAHLSKGQAALKEAASALRHDVAASEAVARARRTKFSVVGCCHIHDEASLRLRSLDPTETANRSKRSNVQQHAVWLQAADGAPQQLPVELDALSNKRATTLATSLDRVVRSAAAVARRGLADDQPVCFCHILVGDGISTNAAAARILRAKYEAAPVAPRFEYFQLVVQCANHQCNLVIRSSVEGTSAKEAALQLEAAARARGDRGAAAARAPNFAQARAATSTAKAEPHMQASGHIVRLYKYLMSDYFSEFRAGLVAHVDSLAFVLRSDEAAPRPSRLLPFRGSPAPHGVHGSYRALCRGGYRALCRGSYRAPCGRGSYGARALHHPHRQLLVRVRDGADARPQHVAGADLRGGCGVLGGSCGAPALGGGSWGAPALAEALVE